MFPRGVAQAAVAVLIPFYQRQPGILKRALESVVAQSLPPGVTVTCIIVDDGSPVPAEGELPVLRGTPRFKFSVIKQVNGGVSAARNAGLDALPENTAFVACLDSDDHWDPDHLMRALCALADDADFYFANSEVENEMDWFSNMAGFNHMVEQRLESGNGDFAFLAPAEIIPAFLDDCPAHTSSVVYRLAPFRECRFDRALRSAGEDHLFWFDLVRRAKRVAVNPRVTTRRGHGVDLYRSAQSWDSPECMARLCGNLLKQHRIGEMVAQHPQLRTSSTRQLDKIRQELLVVMLRSVRRYPAKFGRALVFLLRHDRCFFRLLWRNGHAVWRRKRLTGQFV